MWWQFVGTASRLRVFVPELVRWFFSTRTFWLTALTLAFVFVAAWVCPVGTGEQRVRISGGFLQVLGLLIVGHGLIGKRKLFAGAGPVSKLRAWWSSCPRWTLPPIHGSVAAAVGGVTVTATGGVVGVQVTPTLDERVTQLETQLVAVNSRVAAMEQKADATARDIRSAIDAERSARERADAEQDTRLRGAVAGGIPLEWAGVFFLFVGLVLSAVSVEIGGWLSAVGR